MIKQVRPNYDAHKMDKEIQEFWKSTKAYEKTREHRSKGPDFYFLDGPPYTTGSIHLGTAMNKTLKDVLIRYWRMNGLNVRDQPGFDMHGLPIEVKVEKEVGVRSKKEIEEFGIDRFVETCKKFALELHGSMTEQFKELGVWMDWDNPYQTLRPSYLEAAWWTIAKAYERGLLESANRVLTWCPRCETALAEAEIEYWDEEDPSIFVRFPLRDGSAYLLIWTTTPWTLPANMAVAVHPDHRYVRASMKKDGQSDQYIVMESQLESVAEMGGYTDIRVIQTYTGKELEGLSYIPPFEIANEFIQPGEWTHKVVLADYVESENTGLVHTAPGHGPDDFETGRRYG
ncbi:MAG: class I tRNA ligase family protein, partial [Candidatus Methanomethylophilaceae archaeon]|nr:class I tRNA ligase family protein [Candidatus Methanomethylophilaceae archaeon]